MTDRAIIFTFAANVPMTEVEQTLKLSLIAAEAVYGAMRVQLQASHTIDLEQHTCVIDDSSSVGEALSLLFAGYVLREFGSSNIQIARQAQGAAT
jgi:hypothetical protein